MSDAALVRAISEAAREAAATAPRHRMWEDVARAMLRKYRAITEAVQNTQEQDA